MAFRLFIKNKRIVLYGAALAVLLFLLKWLEFHFIIISNAYEVYVGAIAVLFTLLGIWLALKL
jgi:NarL family two-component system response regulator LiaR